MVEACRARRGPESAEKCCDEQKLEYTLMSSVALFASDGAVVVYGEVADRLGPRTSLAIGSFCVCLGLLLMSINSIVVSDGLWYGSFFVLGLGGPGVFLGAFALQEKHAALRAVMTALAASFWDASAIVFFFFNALYFASDPPPPLSLIALVWLGICVVLAILTWSFLPTFGQIEQIRRAASYETAEDAKVERALQTGGLVSGEGGGRGSGSFASEFFRTDTMLMLGFMSLYNLK